MPVSNEHLSRLILLDFLKEQVTLDILTFLKHPFLGIFEAPPSFYAIFSQLLYPNIIKGNL